MAKNKSKEAEVESTVAESAERTSYALKLFGSPSKLDESKLVRRNLPPLVKPGDVPVDGVVTGEILKIADSMVTTVKGKLLWLRHESGTEFLFPCTGVIRNALVPGVKDEGAELKKALEKEIGKTFVAKRLPDKTSNKFKKNMFMFDVFTN